MGYGGYVSSRATNYHTVSATKTSAEIFSTYRDKKEFKKKSTMSPKNLGIREARDSKEHPESIAVIIALDVTGSMGRIPERIVKGDLSTVMNGLIQAGIDHTQIMFMAIGDHFYDDAPLQVGQFESSDELMAKWLEDTWIESGGGGNACESYNLAWLVGGWHTAIDCFEKRNQKGFLFTIGDEKAFTKIDPKVIKEITGTPGETWTDKDMVAKAREKYFVHHIHTDDGSYPSTRYPSTFGYWKELLGEDAHAVETYHKIAPLIAQIIKDHLGVSKTTQTESVQQDEEEKPTQTML